MERDNFDEAIDEIVAFTGGDMRLALRAILIESVLLEEKLRKVNAASANLRRGRVRIARMGRSGEPQGELTIRTEMAVDEALKR